MSRRRRSSPCSRSQTEAGGIGLYVHIPFCLSKCAYCDFASVPLESAGGLETARRYLDALKVELDLRAASGEFLDAQVDTVYVGGGTPTVLPAEWLADLLARIGQRFALVEGAEVTVEANPGTASAEKVGALLAAGVNRISLGIQSFSDPTLRTLGRLHTAAQAEEAIAAARAAGCVNLSLDLIYAVPGQSLAEWEAALARAVAASPEHISAYGLSVETGTPLAEAIGEGGVAAPDEDEYARMYEAARRGLPQAGYRHYEISNFAREGLECRHNRRYWADDEYLGLGASAHSYRGGIRWNNLGDPGVYMVWLERGVLPVARAERLSAEERVGEMLMLGLRRAEGVAESEVEARCGLAPRAVFGREIEELCDRGLLIAADGALRIPPERWLVSNEALAQFVG